MAFLAMAHEVIIIGIPAWIFGVISGMAPVTVTNKIALKVVMEILGRVERLSIFIEAYILTPRVVVVIGTRMAGITGRECLAPMAVLARIRIGHIRHRWILWNISAYVELAMTSIALHGGREIIDVVPAIVHSGMAAGGPAVML